GAGVRGTKGGAVDAGLDPGAVQSADEEGRARGDEEARGGARDGRAPARGPVGGAAGERRWAGRDRLGAKKMAEVGGQRGRGAVTARGVVAGRGEDDGVQIAAEGRIEDAGCRRVGLLDGAEGVGEGE